MERMPGLRLPRVSSRRVPRGAMLTGIAFVAACALSDALTSPAVETITLSYTGATTLVVGDTVAPTVTAQIGGGAVANPRFRFTIADTTIVGLTAGGDALVARRRGSTAVTAHLLSPVLPDSGPSVTVTLRVVVGAVDVAPGLDTLRSLGDSLSLAATARDVHGGAIPGVPVTWESSDATIISVSAAGWALARRNGSVTIRAIVDDDTGTATLVVAQRIARLQISPGALLLDALTAEAQLGATALDGRDSAIAGVGVSWSTLDGSVASVTSGGRVRALANGTARIRAGSGSVADTLIVTIEQRATQIVISPDPVPGISALGDQVQLAASATDRLGFGVVAPGKTPSWSTLDPTVTIVTTTGLVTGIGTGSGRIVAVLDAARDTADIAVTNSPVTMDVSPGLATLASVDDTLQLAATARNSRGVIVSSLSVTWQALDNGIVQVLSDGRAIAVGTGTGRVVGSVSGVADTALITVTNAPFFVDIVSTNAVLASLGDSLTPPVDFRNARGASLARSAVTWSSDDPLVVRVTAGGIIIARDTGTTTIRATNPYDAAKRDSIIVTSTNAPASIVLSGSLDTMTASGQTLVYTDTVRNARGTILANYPVVWTSTNPGAADVTQTGTVTMTGTGTSLITVQAGSVADTLTIVSRNPSLLYVDNGVFAAQRFGTRKRPFARIQDAVVAADANDTVFVARGNSSYSETVALTRRVTILGDSSAFVAGARDSTLLPVLSHDSGAAAITALTTAQTTIKYLAIRHTLDGLALDANGSDIQLEWIYVNPTATSRVGRGIRVRNAGSGTAIRNGSVRQVRGFGIRFEDVFGGVIARMRVNNVDSAGGTDLGVAIHVVRGANNRVDSTVTRSTEGPQVQLDSALATQFRWNSLAGKHQLMRIRGYSRLTVLNADTFDLNFRPGELGEDNLNSFNDGRSGLEIRNAGLVTVGDLSFGSGSVFRQNPSENAFFGTMTGVHFIDQVRDQGSASSVNGAKFKGGYRNIHSERSAWSTARTHFDSSGAAIWSENDLEVSVLEDSLSNIHTSCVRVSGTLTSVSIFQNARFVNCGWSTFSNYIAVDITTSNSVVVRNSTFAGANQKPMRVNAGAASVTLRDNIFTGAGTRTDTVTTIAGVIDATAGSILMINNRISEYHHTAGARLAASTVRVDSNTFSRNRRGLRIASFSTFTSRDNELFDNDSSGVVNDVAAALTMTDNWWGDDRGPRQDAAPAATGDSAAGNVTFSPVRTTPRLTGTVAAGPRLVRGSGQTAPRGTVLPKALTARVVDATGRPVAGVNVTFTVAGGGGNIGGLSSVVVVTNASGLAEVTATLGAAAGPNTFTATAAGVTVTFTATGT